MLAADAVDAMPSGELVAAVIQCRLDDTPGWFPLNLPNAGQVADLPAGRRGREHVRRRRRRACGAATP